MTTHRLDLALVALATLAAAACDSNSSSGSAPGPCESLTPPPECSVTCTITSDCPAGFHCGPEGTCTADCTQGGSECGDGRVCDPQGTCVDEPDDPGCPNVAVNLQPEIPTVQLVIDQSGSMNEDFMGVDRWSALVEALVDPTDGVVAQLESRVIFGATLYSSFNGDSGGTCPVLEEVAPAFDNYDAINALLEGSDPLDDTPTAEALAVVRQQFPPVNPERPGPRIILLATDGDPDNCDDPDAHTVQTQQLSEAEVVAAFADGIQTFVLSVGPDTSQTHLQRLANAGQGQPLDTGTETFYVANNPAELVAAFNEIIRGVRTCTFQLDGTVDVNKASTGVVELNGQPLEFGTDWRLVDEDTLELLGEACDLFLEQDNVLLTAEFECGAVVL